MIGQTLSHYRIVQKLGGGGMGVGFSCAEDTRLARPVPVPVKSLPEDRGPDDESLQRFERAARAAWALDNPHICTIHDINTHEGKPFLAMELIEGQTLGHAVEGRALLAVAQAMRALRDLRALADDRRLAMFRGEAETSAGEPHAVLNRTDRL